MKVKYIQNSFKSANGKTDVNYYIYEPVNVPIKGVVQISHGMCEYMDRYNHFAHFLCRNGFVVCGNDHVGHGNSVANENNFGFFATKEGYKVVISDFITMTKKIRIKYRKLPLIVLGHSMGSLIARCAVPLLNIKPDIIVLSGTAGPSSLVNSGLIASRSIIGAKGPLYRSGLLHKMVFNNYNNKYGADQQTGFDWLTRDEAIVKKYINDDKCNFIFTSSAFNDLFHLSKIANDHRTYKKFPKQVPILLISGKMDPVGGYAKGVLAVASRFKSAGITDVETILYDDARHEILNETNRDVVYDDILNYINKKLENISPTL